MKKLFLLLLTVALGLASYAQPNYRADRQQESLTRALTAVATSQGKTFLSWRYFESDNHQYSYQLFHNGRQIGTFSRTNYLYPVESEADDIYELRVVDENGDVVEQMQTTPWTGSTLKIPLQRPTTDAAGGTGLLYSPNDCSVGDADGDGEMEIFVKWDPSTSKDNSQNGKTNDVIIDCYKMDGTLLWRIDLGPNIRAGAHYTQFLVYDFDGDGRAELICKTAPWSKDGKGNYVSAAATDNTIKSQTKNTQSYRNSNGYVLEGPEFLTVFSGADGHAIHTTWYNPDRAFGINAKNMSPAYTSSWGDSYGGRGDRFLAAVAYLDGMKPSAVFCRGYYTQAFVWAVDFNGTELVHRWLHASTSKTKVEHYDANWTKTTRTYNSSPANEGRHTLYGNGNHNLTIGDVDGDGCDEIIWGSGAVDNDGKLLYSVGFGHGDAIHMGTFNPDRPGLQVFDIHEDKGTYAWDLHDAATGEIIFKGGPEGVDNGRGICAHLLPGVDEAVFSSSKQRQQYSAATGQMVTSTSASLNFRVYWDDDLQEELADGGYDSNYTISKFKTTSSLSTIATLSGSSCNTTKATPNLLADLFGDWREEVILHDDDNLYVHTSTTLTDYVVPALLTDHIYRMAVAWQQTAYNQPPHLGYFLPDKAYLVTEPDETLLPDDYVQQFEEEEVAITWVLSNGTIDEEPEIISVVPEAIAATSITHGSLLEVSGQGVNQSSVEASKYQTKFKSLQKIATPTNDQAILFTVEPAEGFKFKPTSVKLTSTRYGTNGGYFNVGWLSEAGETTLKSEVHPLRNNDYTDNGSTVSQKPYYNTYNMSVSDVYRKGNGALRISIYNLDANKELGFCNVIIRGKVRKPVVPEPETPTAILDISNRPTDHSTYNIYGQRVDNLQSLPAGIYIKNGRKVLKK